MVRLETPSRPLWRHCIVTLLFTNTGSPISHYIHTCMQDTSCYICYATPNYRLCVLRTWPDPNPFLEGGIEAYTSIYRCHIVPYRALLHCWIHWSLNHLTGVFRFIMICRIIRKLPAEDGVAPLGARPSDGMIWHIYNIKLINSLWLIDAVVKIGHHWLSNGLSSPTGTWTSTDVLSIVN